MERPYALCMQTFSKMIKKWSCEHLADVNHQFEGIYSGRNIFSVSSGMEQQTDVIDCYSDRKSAGHNKCGKGKTRSSHSHLTQQAMGAALWQCPLCCYHVHLSISSPFCHPSTQHCNNFIW